MELKKKRITDRPTNRRTDGPMEYIEMRGRTDTYCFIAAKNLQLSRIHRIYALLGKHFQEPFIFFYFFFQEPFASQINVKTINARETRTGCQEFRINPIQE